MSKKKVKWYIMAVLAYYRAEWTDVSDDDLDYRLMVTGELEQLIRGCMRRGTSVPNAAKEVEIFLDLQDAKVQSSLEHLKKIDPDNPDPGDEQDA